MNKLIAIRRLDATPTSHSFTLFIETEVDDKLIKCEGATEEQYFKKQIIVDVTHGKVANCFSNPHSSMITKNY